MKIIAQLVIDIATGVELEREEFEYSGPLALCDRAAQKAASQAADVAGSTAGQYGSQAGGISANLTPFLTRQMNNPQGYSQRDIGAQLTSALAGSGGATSGLTGAAGKMAVSTRNPMGFSAALGESSRQRDKAAAGASENVATQNANVKLQQQQQAEQGLAGLYGTDVSAQLGAQRNQTADIDAETEAGKSGWLQNLTGVMNAGANVASGIANLKKGCWVASEIFGGWEEPRTVLVRKWLNEDFTKGLIGKLVMQFYVAYGERIAGWVRKSKLVRAILTPLFNLALKKAQEQSWR